MLRAAGESDLLKLLSNTLQKGSPNAKNGLGQKKVVKLHVRYYFGLTLQPAYVFIHFRIVRHKPVIIRILSCTELVN